MPLSKRRVGLRPRGAARGSKGTTRSSGVNTEANDDSGCCHYVLLAVFAVMTVVTAGSYAKENPQWFADQFDPPSSASRLGSSAHPGHEPKAESQSASEASPVSVSTPLDLSHLPAQCTHEEMNTLASQLPSTHCGEAGHMQKCSITQATVKSQCPDPYAFRQYYSGDQDTSTFHSLFAEYSPTDTTLNSVLRVGSHDHNKYPLGCWPDDVPVLGTHRDVTAAVLTTRNDISALKTLVSDQSVLSIYSKDTKQLFSGKTPLDTYLQENNLLQDAIHFMRVSSGGVQDGNDYHILMGALNTLKRVRLLEFQTNYRGAFNTQPRKPVFDALRNQAGMVCYWYGGKPDQSALPNLWRITDCWQTHYDYKSHWASVICVSSLHEDSRAIMAKMEEHFQLTLKRSQVFGG